MTKIIITTKQGNIIKFDSKDLPTQKRGGVGIKAMQIRQGDEIISVTSFNEKN